MEVIIRRAAGLDVHKNTVMACVLLVEGNKQPERRLRQFGTTTGQLRNLAKWLAAQQVTHVAMESTGVYWKPVWNVLEEGDAVFELLLCNAQHLKQVPGRKTDAKDSEWIAHLLQHGLLRGSFVPSRGLRDLRDLTRTRVKVTEEKSAAANRLQKVLEDANVKLGSVASDVLGKSGRAMIQALIEGEHDPRKLAQLAKHRLRAKLPQLREALEGTVTEHHRFMLRLHYDQILHSETVLERLDERIAELTRGAAGSSSDVLEESDPTLPLFPEDPGEDDDPPPGGGGKAARPGGQAASPSPKRRKRNRRRSQPKRSNQTPSRPPGAFFPEAIELLCTIPGIGTRTAENILAEIGDDMTRFPTARHLASWAGVCPGNNKSAGKQIKRKGATTKGNNFLKRALNQASWGAIRAKDSYFAALYRRLAKRRGKKRAVVAVGHAILVAIWHMLSTGEVYQDLGADHFDRLNSERLTAYHLRRLEKLGYSVTIEQNAATAGAEAA